MYARYLRADSYRRSLSYQKRYLLMLLGDFQYPESAVLAILGRSNLTEILAAGEPESGSLTGESEFGQANHKVGSNDLETESQTNRTRKRLPSLPLIRFRAAARTVLVIHRYV
ncbi:unnamed protein product [Protopolystoma xenopodis]|uniref:Pericentrin/AKAP-450 centrosomal targeting domain-containing protein n=1 Tax=Protopolystoma xenopodis TaxID=117903 RepID=A0A448WPZ6_9PLAT|nr:unnamed protein product [Protopolystoma xenopodis]